MAKIRVYELARELGVDNKEIITRAADLGIPGKTSHSNTLDSDQADQIRRAVIRQAIDAKPEKKVVRTRVSSITGKERTVVESRKGNIIRRRKKTEEEKKVEAVEEVVEEEPSVDTEAAEVEMEGLVAEGALEEAETITEEAAELAEEEASEVVAEEEVAAEAQEEVAEEAAEAEEEEAKTVGPKVLGKIELPQKKVVKAAPKKTTDSKKMVFDDEEEEKGAKRGGRQRGRKRKGKKREFDRGDLVDYEGKGPRRGPKMPKGARAAQTAAQLEDGEPASTEITTPKASKRIVKMDEAITVGEFSKQMSLKAGEIISKLIELGVMATINQVIDQDTATIVAEEFGYTIETTSFDETSILEEEVEDQVEDLEFRAPVVTVMGHVDHGKTSLLDSIRKASVVAREHGGITQHIGAYNVDLADGRRVAFIDTPGHAAFTSMRARGANVTDIVILVVAADDGVMPQTIEAINHAKAAEVPIVVAVNKMDKPDAKPDRVKQQLAEHGLQPEEWGGDTMFFNISALQGDGISELLEGLLLVAELKELKANPKRRAAGTIIEARQERGKGTVVTVLVQHGTLKTGDIFVSGAESGRVRAMTNHRGEKMDEAGPSVPVEVTGFSAVPLAGDDFVVVESESKARQVATHRTEQRRMKAQVALAGGPISLEEFAQRTRTDIALELNLILKADVHGSLEAVREAVDGLSGDKVMIRVIHGGVGGVNESDIQLALASKAIIIGFNVRAELRAMSEAERIGIDIRFYRVIYELVDDVKKAMAGLLAPIKKEVHLGRAEVRDTFSVPKIGVVAGCYISDGMIKRGASLRLLRDSRVIHEGKMLSLRRFKDDVKEVQTGYECGISIDGFNDIKSGDVIEAFEIQEEAATL